MWSENSPDLNPIEHLWSGPKDSAYQEPYPTTVHELQARFEENWNSLPVELLQKLAKSFKTRVEKMMKTDARHTTYWGIWKKFKIFKYFNLHSFMSSSKLS